DGTGSAGAGRGRVIKHKSGRNEQSRHRGARRAGSVMGVRTWIESWPAYRQLSGGDVLGRGAAAKSRTSSRLAPRTQTADRVIETRRAGWQWEQDGKRTRRTMGIASLGGATLDNEENYLIKKLFTALGAIQIENQARI